MDDYRDQDTWYEVQGRYAFGWELLTSEDTREDAEDTLSVYRENEPQTPFRVRPVRGQA